MPALRAGKDRMRNEGSIHDEHLRVDVRRDDTAIAMPIQIAETTEVADTRCDDV